MPAEKERESVKGSLFICVRFFVCLSIISHIAVPPVCNLFLRSEMIYNILRNPLHSVKFYAIIGIKAGLHDAFHGWNASCSKLKRLLKTSNASEGRKRNEKETDCITQLCAADERRQHTDSRVGTDCEQ